MFFILPSWKHHQHCISLESCCCAEIATSAGFLRPGRGVAVTARTMATSTTSTAFAITTAAARTATSTTVSTSAATATLAVAASTEATTTAPGSTSNLVEAVVRSTVGLGSAVCCSFLARCLGVPRLACRVSGGGIVGPAGNGLRLRSLDRCGSRGVDLVIGPGNDLVAVLDVLRLGTSGRIPVLAGNVALGMDGRSGSLLVSGRAIGLRLLELGQTGVCGSRVRASRDRILNRSLGS
jgi:hypothetical protein